MNAVIRISDVAYKRGLAWIAGGWRIFRGAPLVWMGLGAGWMLITFGLVLVPVIGGVVANLLQPVFFASFARAAAKQRAGGRIEAGDLFAGFRRPLRPLVNIGAILLVAELGIFLLMSLLGLPGMAGAEGEQLTIEEYLAALQGNEWILVVGLLLTAIVKGALWFAPALLAFRDLSTAHAIRWSVFAALSNIGAMVTYGIALTVVVAAAILPYGLGLLVAVPVMLASTYAGYAEVFGAPEDGAG